MATTVEMPTGKWVAEHYVSYQSSDEPLPDEENYTISSGVDIKLSFYPNENLLRTKNIWLVQFKNPIMKDGEFTQKGWALDRGKVNLLPYFGWETRDKPMTITGAARNVQSKLLGKEMARRGRVFNSDDSIKPNLAKPAYIIDTVREPCRGLVKGGGRINATFTTYAYDEDNDRWLGGVSWGYSAMVGDDGCPKVTQHPLRSRSIGALRSEESETCAVWMNKAPSGRIPVSSTTEVASEVVSGADQEFEQQRQWQPYHGSQ